MGKNYFIELISISIDAHFAMILVLQRGKGLLIKITFDFAQLINQSPLVAIHLQYMIKAHHAYFFLLICIVFG